MSFDRSSANGSTREPFESFGAFRAPEGWPDAMSQVAYHGPVGEFVRLLDPHTEADSAALLIQLMVQFGNVVGRDPHFRAEADRHAANLFTVLVGDTSKGRKGTSFSQVHCRFHPIDERWATDRQLTGLSSGEGLIWAVRDSAETGGVQDKRLLIVEPEFASTLRVLGRDGNSLSGVMRQSWDTGNLGILTKNSPAKATGAHISIIGHVTRDELLRYLTRTETANGFANRFLWICVRRSKVLPEGGKIGEVEFGPLMEDLRAAIAFARTVGEMRRDDAARELWFDVYEPLSEGTPGMLGAVTSRAEAQVMRMAMIYALLDRSAEIKRPHLEAGLEVWRYALDSAVYVFGEQVGSPIVDEIGRALLATPLGLTRTEIRNLGARHWSSEEIDAALGLSWVSILARERRPLQAGRPLDSTGLLLRSTHGNFNAFA